MATTSELDEAALAEADVKRWKLHLHSGRSPYVQIGYGEITRVERVVAELRAARQRIAELEKEIPAWAAYEKTEGWPRDGLIAIGNSLNAKDRRIAELEGERAPIVEGCALVCESRGASLRHQDVPRHSEANEAGKCARAIRQYATAPHLLVERATPAARSEPPIGKYGQTGRAFASAVCPVCDASVWRDQFTGLFWSEGGLARHEHPTPAAREGAAR